MTRALAPLFFALVSWARKSTSPPAEALVGHDLPAEARVGLDEVLGQPLGVVAADVMDDGRFLDAELAVEVFGDDLALVGIGEADAEHVGVQLAFGCHRYVQVRGDCSDLGNPVLRGEGGRGDVDAASVGSDDGDHLVILGHPAEGVHRIFRACAEVIGNELELLAQNAALGVDLVNC